MLYEFALSPHYDEEIIHIIRLDLVYEYRGHRLYRTDRAGRHNDKGEASQASATDAAYSSCGHYGRNGTDRIRPYSRRLGGITNNVDVVVRFIKEIREMLHNVSLIVNF